MKKHITHFSLFLLAIFILASCSSSDKAVTGNFIQKRKYNTGYHVSLFSKHHKKQQVHEQELFAEKIKKERKEELKQNTNNEEVYASVSTDKSTNPIVVKKAVSKSEKKELKKIKKKAVLDFKKEKRLAKKKTKKELKKISNSINEGGEGELSTFALVGFIASLVGLILFVLFAWPFLLGTLGVIFSSIGLSETKKGKTGKGFAIAGLVIGILDILLFWAVLILVILLFAAAA